METQTTDQLINNKTLHFTSLGCSKNLVDSQVMLGHLGLDGYKVVPEASEAEVIVVNTCSFIDLAKQESIDTILEMSDYKNEGEGNCKALVVSGCMAQRYSADLEKEMPEVDMFIGTGEYYKIPKLLKAYSEGKLEKKSFVEIPKFIHTEYDPRINTSPSYMAWLKISEGCNRNCSFCIIPTIRGKLRSRSVDSLVNESQQLVESGVKELNLISQDLSDYGVDLQDSDNIYNLLSSLEKVQGAKWLRLFYFYPDELSDEVIDLMAASKVITPYLDMPIQHLSDRVLKRMNRRITGAQIMNRVDRLREKMPNMFLRTSVIVGFPGESQEDFDKLYEGIKNARFNHLGVFKYSDEEGTPAFRLKDKVDQEIIEERFDKIYNLQKEVVHELNQELVGKTMEVIVEGIHPESELLMIGRHIGQAPDIDGNVIINEGNAQTGDIVKVKITDAFGYDLVGGMVENLIN
jgi:ribosomal protein S12 methylthiotransferase